MTKKTPTRTPRPGILGLLLFLLAGAVPAGALGEPLSLEEAVRRAAETDPRITAGLLDVTAARMEAEAARKQRYPSLSLSGAYTYLSPLTSAIDLGGTPISIESQENTFSFAANLQVPVFSGNRIRETIAMAEHQVLGREIAAEALRLAVEYETRRAYWEAWRAVQNTAMLKENLSLVEQNRTVTGQRLSQGTVLNADLLAADMRYNQAEMDLGDAGAFQSRAFLNLETLVSPPAGQDGTAGKDAPETDDPPFDLTSVPEDLPLPEEIRKVLSGEQSEEDFLKDSLGRRPETRSADLAIRMAETAESLAAAPLYPAVTVSGNYTLANPNPRVFMPPEPSFTGTWNLSLGFSYSLGGVPAVLDSLKAREAAREKSGADRQQQERLIIRDLRTCLVAFRQSERNMELVTRMLDQARENERVTAQKVRSGVASDLDLLEASLARLRSEFAIRNRRIDLQIAAADLCRAAGLSMVQ